MNEIDLKKLYLGKSIRQPKPSRNNFEFYYRDPVFKVKKLGWKWPVTKKLRVLQGVCV